MRWEVKRTAYGISVKLILYYTQRVRLVNFLMSWWCDECKFRTERFSMIKQYGLWKWILYLPCYHLCDFLKVSMVYWFLRFIGFHYDSGEVQSWPQTTRLNTTPIQAHCLWPCYLVCQYRWSNLYTERSMSTHMTTSLCLWAVLLSVTCTFTS